MPVRKGALRRKPGTELVPVRRRPPARVVEEYGPPAWASQKVDPQPYELGDEVVLAIEAEHGSDHTRYMTMLERLAPLAAAEATGRGAQLMDALLAVPVPEFDLAVYESLLAALPSLPSGGPATAPGVAA